VVADFNGDGRPDIATASADPSFAGVQVFLSRYSNTGFQGFREPIYSPLPGLTTFGFLQRATPVLAMAAGDYDGDGTMDLALATTQQQPGVNPQGDNVIIIMRNSAQSVTGDGSTLGSGYFFADFSSGSPLAALSELNRPICAPRL
jgi:hypothetical protein